MITVSIARRYARALFEVGLEEGKVDAWGEKLRVLTDAFRESPEIWDLMQDPAFSKEQRQAVMAAVAKAIEADPMFMSLLRLLVDRNRLSYLESIARLYSDLADAHAGRVRAKVVSAVELSKAASQNISKALERATRRKVLLEHAVEPSIIGGLVAQVDSLMFDGSVRTQLENLRRELKQA